MRELCVERIDLSIHRVLHRWLAESRKETLDDSARQAQSVLDLRGCQRKPSMKGKGQWSEVVKNQQGAERQR